MEKSVVEVEVKAVLPTSGGCAVFLGDDEKVFVIYVDQAVGAAITMFMHHTPKPRPQTHDLFADVLTALGAHVERVVINDYNESGLDYGMALAKRLAGDRAAYFACAKNAMALDRSWKKSANDYEKLYNALVKKA